MLSSAVRDLKKSHGDEYLIDVATSAPEIWENNPHLTKIHPSEADIIVNCEYPLINKSNDYAYHFIHGYSIFLEKTLDCRIPVTLFKGDIHLANEEKLWMSQIEEMGERRPFWIIDAGGKFDFTAKWAPPSLYQSVVNHFKDKIVFVQTGSANHWHPRIKGAIDLVGKTSMRQMIRLMYHAVGVITPVSFPMHLSAAVESRYGLKYRPCIVLAGGREGNHWEAYPGHKYLHSVGQYKCCAAGGCWKSRCTEIKDNDKKNENLCENRVFIRKAKKEEKPHFDNLYSPKCLSDIKPKTIIEEIEKYYENEILSYSWN